MNSLKVTLLGLSLLFVAMPASADLSSYFNPFAWIRAAQRAYYWKKNPVRMGVAKKELERLYEVRLELDNFEKIHKQINPTFKLSEIGTKEQLMEDIKQIKEKLDNEFWEKQEDWKIDEYLHGTSNIAVVKTKLQRSIKQKEQQVGEIAEPISWHEGLKQDVNDLPRKERNKTVHKRKADFEAWQKKYYADQAKTIVIAEDKNGVTTVVQAKDRDDWFNEWRKKNPDYKKPEMNK